MTYIRTWTVLVRVNTGAPTWWRPDLGIKREGRLLIVRAGWLRACIQVALGTRQHDDEPTPDPTDDRLPERGAAR